MLGRRLNSFAPAVESIKEGEQKKTRVRQRSQPVPKLLLPCGLGDYELYGPHSKLVFRRESGGLSRPRLNQIATKS